jgi:hypothetical protein
MPIFTKLRGVAFSSSMEHTNLTERLKEKKTERDRSIPLLFLLKCLHYGFLLYSQECRSREGTELKQLNNVGQV